MNIKKLIFLTCIACLPTIHPLQGINGTPQHNVTTQSAAISQDDASCQNDQPTSHTDQEPVASIPQDPVFNDTKSIVFLVITTCYLVHQFINWSIH